MGECVFAEIDTPTAVPPPHPSGDSLADLDRLIAGHDSIRNYLVTAEARCQVLNAWVS